MRKALTILAASLTCTALFSGPAQAEEAKACDPLYLVVPGTDQTRANSNTSKPSPDFKKLGALPEAKGKELFYLAYPAELGAGNTTADSMKAGLEAGVKEINKRAKKCDDLKVSLIGSSQGAAVAGDIFAEIVKGDTDVDPENVVTAQLLSDPKRSGIDNIYGENNKFIGLMGEREEGAFGDYADKVLSHCVKGDIVCDVEPGSALEALSQALRTPGLEEKIPGKSLHETLGNLTIQSLQADIWPLIPDERKMDFAGMLLAYQQVMGWEQNKLHYLYGETTPMGETETMTQKAYEEFLTA